MRVGEGEKRWVVNRLAFTRRALFSCSSHCERIRENRRPSERKRDARMRRFERLRAGQCISLMYVPRARARSNILGSRFCK